MSNGKIFSGNQYQFAFLKISISLKKNTIVYSKKHFQYKLIVETSQLIALQIN